MPCSAILPGSVIKFHNNESCKSRNWGNVLKKKPWNKYTRNKSIHVNLEEAGAVPRTARLLSQLIAESQPGLEHSTELSLSFGFVLQGGERTKDACTRLAGSRATARSGCRGQAPLSPAPRSQTGGGRNSGGCSCRMSKAAPYFSWFSGLVTMSVGRATPVWTLGCLWALWTCQLPVFGIARFSCWQAPGQLCWCRSSSEGSLWEELSLLLLLPSLSVAAAGFQNLIASIRVGQCSSPGWAAHWSALGPAPLQNWNHWGSLGLIQTPCKCDCKLQGMCQAASAARALPTRIPADGSRTLGYFCVCNSFCPQRWVWQPERGLPAFPQGQERSIADDQCQVLKNYLLIKNYYIIKTITLVPGEALGIFRRHPLGTPVQIYCTCIDIQFPQVHDVCFPPKENFLQLISIAWKWQLFQHTGTPFHDIFKLTTFSPSTPWTCSASKCKCIKLKGFNPFQVHA